MRPVTIILALVVGLVGLLMSVCGGGLFIITAYKAVNILRPAPQAGGLDLVTLTISAASAALGAALLWVCYKIIRSARKRG